METSSAPTASVQTPEEADEIEAPTPVQQSKALSFSNGVLKRHQPLQHLNVPTHPVVTYKECLKNHAAGLGGHALDGCGEFMPSPTANLADPTSLKCAACGCHRNFHRREPDEPLQPPFTSSAQHLIEYQPHHRHHPPPPKPQQPRGGHSSPNSASPPPISSSYFPSAPHMLLALSSGLSGPPPENNPTAAIAATPTSRKRFRTRFTQDQKERMLEFADRVGWKMQKRDEESIGDFCGKIGVDRSVFKVWMHNNKSILGKRDVMKSNGNGIRNDNSAAALDNNEDLHGRDLDHHRHNNNGRVISSAQVVVTNGSSSSS